MAYDEFLAEHIRNYFTEKHLNFFEKNMMGGRVFMLNDKMCCGIHYDKKRNCDLLMARVGSAVAEKLMKRKGCHPMDFTGRPMKGYVFVTAEGFDTDEELEYWIQLCIDFNPLAKASKKRKKKS